MGPGSWFRGTTSTNPATCWELDWLNPAGMVKVNVPVAGLQVMPVSFTSQVTFTELSAARPAMRLYSAILRSLGARPASVMTWGSVANHTETTLGSSDKMPTVSNGTESVGSAEHASLMVVCRRSMSSADTVRQAPYSVDDGAGEAGVGGAAAGEGCTGQQCGQNSTMLASVHV